MGTPKTILVTGATGFVGRHLCDYLRARGNAVRGLARRTDNYPFTQPGVTLFKADLPAEIDAAAFQGADAVIHCAYTTRAASMEAAYRVNHIGTMKVYEMSRKAKAGQFVFISSIAAHPDAESYYGKSKFSLEQLMDAGKDLVIRPGLVLGPGEAGTFGRVKESLRKSGIVPIFDGGRQILQTIHIDDLCKGVDLAVEKKLTGILVMAEPDGLEMRNFFKLVAAGMNKKCTLVPLPMGLFLAALRVIEKLHVPFPVSSENLLGLKQMRHTPSAADLAKVGLQVRSAEESLKTSLQ